MTNNNLIEIIEQYQKGNKNEAMSNLISFQTTGEGRSSITNLKIKNNKLDRLLKKLKATYSLVSDDEIESYFINTLSDYNHRDEDIGLFAKVNIKDFEEHQIERYIIDKINWSMNTQYNKNNFFNENVESIEASYSDDDTSDSEVYKVSSVDKASFDSWVNGGVDTWLGEAMSDNTKLTDEKSMQFKSYLEKLGDLLSIESKVLTKAQKLYVELHYFEGKTQAEIANELNVTQANVSKVIRAANTKIKNLYSEKRVAEMVSKDKSSNLDKAKQLLDKLEEVEEIMEIDDNQYFEFIVNFVRNNIKKESVIDYEYLQKNKIELDSTEMGDIITDNLLPAQFELYDDVTEVVLMNDAQLLDKLTVAVKKRYTTMIISSLYKVIDNLDVNINRFIKTAVNNDKVDEVIELFK